MLQVSRVALTDGIRYLTGCQLNAGGRKDRNQANLDHLALCNIPQ